MLESLIIVLMQTSFCFCCIGEPKHAIDLRVLRGVVVPAPSAVISANLSAGLLVVMPIFQMVRPFFVGGA